MRREGKTKLMLPSDLEVGSRFTARQNQTNLLNSLGSWWIGKRTIRDWRGMKQLKRRWLFLRSGRCYVGIQRPISGEGQSVIIDGFFLDTQLLFSYVELTLRRVLINHGDCSSSIPNISTSPIDSRFRGLPIRRLVRTGPDLV